MKNNRTTKKKSVKAKANKELVNNYVLGGVVLFAVVYSLCIFTSSMGMVGDFIRRSALFLFGNTAYILPLLLLVFAYNIFSKNNKKTDAIIIFATVFLLLLIAGMMDLSSPIPGIIKDRMSIFQNEKLINLGGGFFGALLSSMFLNLFGKLGLTLLEVIGIVVCVILLFDLDVKKALRAGYIGISKAGEFISVKREEYKEKKRIEKLKQDIAVQHELEYEEVKKPIKNEFEDDRELVVIDYDESEAVEDEPEEQFDDYIGEVESKPKSEPVQRIQPKVVKTKYVFPPVSLLNASGGGKKNDRDAIYRNSQIIEETMANFGIDAKVVKVNSGPTVTCYELVPDAGVRLNKIVNLSDNLAFSLASQDIRIEAPIPGKTAVGIEVPNANKAMVTLGEIIRSESFKSAETDLPLVLGKDVSGQEIISSIDDMPHLLIAGATGAGKSVCINSIILSLLYKSSPDDVKLILIDPKIVELSIYNGIPHLLIPVVTNPKRAASALNWAVEEMERRYKLFAKNSVRDIKAYNAIEPAEDDEEYEELPKIVIIIDELSDLMMVASNEVEDYVTRLAQMARAAGIYLIIATQRPSVDVITGIIKANIPSRISFAVSSQIDSRTILDMAGAEKLLGKGDMLFYPSFYSKPKRIQGTFVSDKEVEKVVNHIKKSAIAQYNEDVINEINTTKQIKVDTSDPILEEAIDIILNEETASISYLQRKLRIGYSRAARIVDSMEDMGIVGPSEGSKPRKVLMTKEEYLNQIGGSEE